MAISLVQAVGPTTGASQTSYSVTIAATGAGNTLIVCSTESSTGSNPNISGVTLGGSGTGWAAAETSLNASGVNAEIWSAGSIAGGQTTVVISLTGGTGTAFTCAYVFEVAGLTGVVDKIAQTGNTTGGASQTVTSGATATTANANEFWVGVVYNFYTAGAQTFTNVGAWTNSTQESQTGSLFFAQSMAGYQIVSSAAAATYSATIPESTVWSACVATYLPAPSGSTSGPNYATAQSSSVWVNPVNATGAPDGSFATWTGP